MKKTAAATFAFAMLFSLIQLNPADAAVNYRLGSKFNLGVIFVFTDPDDAANDCDFLTGRYAVLMKSTITVRDSSNKVLAISPKPSYGVGYKIMNSLVDGGVTRNFRRISYDECAVSYVASNISSKNKFFRVSLANIASYKYTYNQVKSVVTNGEADFQEFLE